VIINSHFYIITGVIEWSDKIYFNFITEMICITIVEGVLAIEYFGSAIGERNAGTIGLYFNGSTCGKRSSSSVS
jgi:hypothetical protein